MGEENEENLERIKKLISKIDDLQENLGNLSEKEADLLNKIDECNADHDKKMSGKQDEIKRLLEDISGQEEEYKTLLEDKNALDTEISVYKKLMESEEERLGIKTGDGP